MHSLRVSTATLVGISVWDFLIGGLSGESQGKLFFLCRLVTFETETLHSCSTRGSSDALLPTTPQSRFLLQKTEVNNEPFPSILLSGIKNCYWCLGHRMCSKASSLMTSCCHTTVVAQAPSQCLLLATIPQPINPASMESCFLFPSRWPSFSLIS